MSKVEILINSQWVEIPFVTLNVGDVFRMFTPDGKPVVDEMDDKSEFVAMSEVIYAEGREPSIQFKGRN